jgi:hypothetical protein
MAVAVTVGLVALVLSMVGAHWSEAPAEQAIVVAIPPLAVPPGTDAAADLPPAPDAAIQRPDHPQNALVTAALQATSDPVLPDELALLPLESIEALKRSTAAWESRAGPVAVAPSAGPSRSTTGDRAPSPAQQSGTVPVQASRPLQQVAADPAPPGSAASLQVASQTSTPDDHSDLTAGGIRIFIHHVADQRDGALAEQLAEYLRGQGFTVADIRSVDFGIGSPACVTSSRATAPPASGWSRSLAGFPREGRPWRRIARATSPISFRSRVRAASRSGCPAREVGGDGLRDHVLDIRLQLRRQLAWAVFAGTCSP